MPLSGLPRGAGAMLAFRDGSCAAACGRHPLRLPDSAPGGLQILIEEAAQSCRSLCRRDDREAVDAEFGAPRHEWLVDLPQADGHLDIGLPAWAQSRRRSASCALNCCASGMTGIHPSPHGLPPARRAGRYRRPARAGAAAALALARARSGRSSRAGRGIRVRAGSRSPFIAWICSAITSHRSAGSTPWLRISSTSQPAPTPNRKRPWAGRGGHPRRGELRAARHRRPPRPAQPARAGRGAAGVPGRARVGG